MQMAMAGRHDRPVHGGLNYAELESLGLRAEQVIDFSASINPLGPSSQVLEAAQAVNLAAYPDPECLKLREAIGLALGVEPARILAGNGSTELIHLIARTFLSSGDAALIFDPTFGEYDAACRAQCVAPEFVRSTPEEQFRWDLASAIEHIRAVRPSAAFLCNPNNPTGVYLDEEEVRSIAESLRGIGVLVLDEAYVPFVRESWDTLPLLSMGNVVILRSMTKDHALTGLRLGYMLAPEEIVARVVAHQYSWSVNAPAQAAGIAAISDRSQVEKGREAVRKGKEFLMREARSMGLECLPAAANFLVFRVGRAAELRHELLARHRVCVRDCASFGMPEYIRVGVRKMEDNRRLVDALKDVLTTRSYLA